MSIISIAYYVIQEGYYMIDEEFFRDRLRALRNERQVSEREMSLALGQNESYINKIGYK